MPKRVMIDSGPLIALFDKDDTYHKKSLDFIKRFKGELFSNCAVITEVCHLLDFSVIAQLNFLEWVHLGGVTIADITVEDLSRIVELTKKYSDLPMDFADASLVVLGERLKIHDIASIDRDFNIYRMHDKKGFKNVFKDAAVQPG